jgi:hypothetical protein
MSIKVTYRKGVFVPVDDVTNVHPGQNYTVYSDQELAEIRETIGPKIADKTFEFWDNSADAVYDNL